ncbi:MAG: GntR family transcriptional regulator [bacterium]|nr:GntR family transcriptional regulator [bacterium]
MIVRKSLRADVQKEILARLADQRLAPGSRVNESHLSAELGVSRTPLREAMLGLEAAGFLGSDVGRGFLVPALVAGPFREAQQVLTRLAPAALAQTRPAAPRLMELQNLIGRARMRLGAAPAERAADLAPLSQRWSHLLLENCPNRTLQQDIARLEALSVRAWREALRRGFDAAGQVDSWQALYELVRTGQIETAATAWGRHLETYGAAAAALLPEVAEARSTAS